MLDSIGQSWSSMGTYEIIQIRRRNPDWTSALDMPKAAVFNHAAADRLFGNVQNICRLGYGIERLTFLEETWHD